MPRRSGTSMDEDDSSASCGRLGVAEPPPMIYSLRLILAGLFRRLMPSTLAAITRRMKLPGVAASPASMAGARAADRSVRVWDMYRFHSRKFVDMAGKSLSATPTEAVESFCDRSGKGLWVVSTTGAREPGHKKLTRKTGGRHVTNFP